jgi:hypothetical protein
MECVVHDGVNLKVIGKNLRNWQLCKSISLTWQVFCQFQICLRSDTLSVWIYSATGYKTAHFKMWKNTFINCHCTPYVRLPLWSSGQSSWLQIQRSGFDSRRYQIFWKVVGLEQGPLGLVNKTEELLGRKSSSSGLENWEYTYGDPSCSPRGTFYPQKLALASPTSGGHLVVIVHLRTQAMGF